MSPRARTFGGMMWDMDARLKVLELVERLEDARNRILDFSVDDPSWEFEELRISVDRDLREIALGVARLAD